MAGLDTRRLVLVESTISGSNGKESFVYGTGYFVTDNLVLTAHHVLSKGVPERVRVRVEEGKPRWREAMSQPAWQDEDLDAALLCVNEPLQNIEPPKVGGLSLDKDKAWNSTAYPRASYKAATSGVEHNTSGLSGTCYAHGGKGQGIRDLELTVEAEPKEDDEGWKGISGAPVFIGDTLAGVIKSFPRAYGQSRLHAVPIDLLLHVPSFLLAIAPRWLEPFPSAPWILVLTSEGEPGNLEKIVRGAIKKHAPTIRETLHLMIDTKPKVVSVNEVLKSSQHWLSFVRAMCVAPVMIADITDFQEGVMLLLGIRSVVRRGVTITSTFRHITEIELRSLPFNIQETKLICHDPKEHDFDSKRHPTNLMADSILQGLQQLRTHPAYLDLPAYDAVRCQKPQSPQIVLMLCPFTKEWTDKHFQNLANDVSIEASSDPVRTLDLASPRLVGQALYEHVRWATYCIVDWSRWRPNVFFEFGVRLASTDVGSMCLIDTSDKPLDHGSAAQPNAGPEDKDRNEVYWVNQRRQLLSLFRPREYTLGDYSEAVKDGFRECNNIIDNEYTVEHAVIHHDYTYRTIIDAYDWTQDHVTIPPHQALGARIEALIGKDPQQLRNMAFLYSSRKDFADAIETTIRENWIAAWYYARYLYYTVGDKATRDDLLRLGETVLQTLPKRNGRYAQIRDDIAAIKSQLETALE